MEALIGFFGYFLSQWWGILILAVCVAALIIVLYKAFFKAFFDCLAAFTALIILSPAFIIISVLIKATSPGVVFFRQRRVGKNKKIFTIHKFRTMRADAPKDVPTHMLSNPDAHITKIGRFLRKTSLDELPQIWDIFRLKMSVVGPRPALYNQDDLVAERDKYGANGVRPGLTGLAQVSGRDALEIPVKAKIDGEYVKKRNIFLDIKILFLTALKVFKSDGVVEGGTGTLEKRGEFAFAATSAAPVSRGADKIAADNADCRVACAPRNDGNGIAYVPRNDGAEAVVSDARVMPVAASAAYAEREEE